jgi:hypothetical protein
MNEQNLQNIFNDGFLVDLNVSYWSAQRKLSEQDIGLDEISEAYSLGKKLLIPYDVMHAFKIIESRARVLIDKSSFRFPIGNARFIPKRKFVKVIEELKKLQSEYNALVEDLIINYEKYRNDMHPIYLKAAADAFETKASKIQTFGPNYDPVKEKESFIEQFMARINTCYPSVYSLKAKFGIDLAIFEVALPKLREGDVTDVAENLELQEKLAEEYKIQMRTKITSFVDDVVGVLRQEAIDLCKHVSNNIAEGKIIKSTTISSLTGFIDKFKDMNFVGDKTVENSLDSLKKELLDSHPTSAFSDNEELKIELQRRLNLIAEQAASTTDISSITGEYRRKVNWED